MSKKKYNPPATDHDLLPDGEGAQDAVEMDPPATEPEVVREKLYVCVLAVKEDGGKYKAGAKYEGTGLTDAARLDHLLTRGAIRAVL